MAFEIDWNITSQWKLRLKQRWMCPCIRCHPFECRPSVLIVIMKLLDDSKVTRADGHWIIILMVHRWNRRQSKRKDSFIDCGKTMQWRTQSLIKSPHFAIMNVSARSYYEYFRNDLYGNVDKVFALKLTLKCYSFYYYMLSLSLALALYSFLFCFVALLLPRERVHFSLSFSILCFCSLWGWTKALRLCVAFSLFTSIHIHSWMRESLFLLFFLLSSSSSFFSCASPQSKR